MREDEIGERWPEIPDWADPRELDAEVRRDLRGLSKEGAEFVGAHLFVAGMLAEEDPNLAWRHARAARSKGGRIAVVRETVGLVAYRAGEWAEAIAELRAARRMSGGPGQLPVMADCERALGHPEKAIELSRSAEAIDLDPSSAAELRIVVAGARADLDQLNSALAHLEPALHPETTEPFSARLFYAYADLLLQADRRAEAVDWFMKAAEADVDEETDAGDRLTELAGDEVDDSSVEIEAEVPDEIEVKDEEGDGADLAVPPAGSAPGEHQVVVDPASGLDDESAEHDSVDGARPEHEGSEDESPEYEGSEDESPEYEASEHEGPEQKRTEHKSIEYASTDDTSSTADGTGGGPATGGGPVRPSTPPSSLSSLFSHHEGGS